MTSLELMVLIYVHTDEYGEWIGCYDFFFDKPICKSITNPSLLLYKNLGFKLHIKSIVNLLISSRFLFVYK